MKNHILILAVIIFLNESLIPFPNYNHAIAQGTKPASEHIIGAYDVLGVYIERVLGNEYELPPVQIPDRESGLTPSTGYPVLVLANGTVALPLVKPIQVKGLTLGIAQSKIRDAYTGILNPRDSPRCMVTLMREPTIEERLLIPKNDYKIGPLDVLGIYLEGITGDPEETKIPVRFASPKEGVIPSAGYPVLVMPDGTISLPLIHPIQVVGLTIDQVDSAIKKAYTETDEPTDQAEDKQENPIRNAAKETTDDVDQPKKKVDDLLIQDPIPSPAIELENQMDRSGILRKNSLIIVTLMRPMKPASAGGQRQSDR